MSRPLAGTRRKARRHGPSHDRATGRRPLQRAQLALAEGNVASAGVYYQEACDAAPQNIDMALCRAAFLQSVGRDAEAEIAARAILEGELGRSGNPIQQAKARVILGGSLRAQGRFEEGWQLFNRRDEYLGPGDERDDLREYRRKLRHLPEWWGENVFLKRVAILAEQGAGDQIQFARFAKLLRGRGALVTLTCHPSLERLFRTMDLDVVPVGAATGVNVDTWASCMSLAPRCGTVGEDFWHGSYLRAPSAWERPLPTGFRVGFKAAGNPAHANDLNRSVRPSVITEAGVDGVSFVDLDPAVTRARDFADTAGLIDELDLVISVDTSVAHLAGAMGKPVWILLPAIGTDWRWMRDRTDSPWYPTARLHRQAKPGQWGDVTSALRRDIAALVSCSSRRTHDSA